LVVPKLIQRINAIISDSQFSKQRILKTFRVSEKRIHVVPCGVNPAQFHPSPQAEREQVQRKYGLPSRYLLTVGSLSPRKNLNTLLEAWHRINAPRGNTTLIIVGAGGRAFRHTRGHHAADSVRWLGYVDDSDLPALYSSALAFVSASLYEGFGLTALEAMACRTPVIVSNTSAFQEVVSDTGIYFDPYEVDAIVGALDQVISNPDLRQELGGRGYQRATAFSWDRTAQGVWDVLQREMDK
jgi:glycosyltransferase involved in cell wall biosynthesis